MESVELIVKTIRFSDKDVVALFRLGCGFGLIWWIVELDSDFPVQLFVKDFDEVVGLAVRSFVDVNQLVSLDNEHQTVERTQVRVALVELSLRLRLKLGCEFNQTTVFVGRQDNRARFVNVFSHFEVDIEESFYKIFMLLYFNFIIILFYKIAKLY